ncbi:hypothetical protein [Clostridium estertheticum]|uniref:hypothetical protein n=1 Tax=Clostridium estertheticum TaxID=238834 RepID=UPI001CF2F814|nr:hypothetical protein [Clostridium estertheticum]MCB2356705.1 hypothetical protein [Clostridium estertheticum]
MPEGYDHKYVHSHFVYKLKVTDGQADTWVSQLKKLSSFISKGKESYKLMVGE